MLHSDGTFATYHHLTAGIPVQEGQTVRRGERIGSCGDSGWSGGPHLHFNVSKRNDLGEAVSVPIRFGLRGAGAFVPKAANYYGRPPRPTVDLRISVDGKPVDLSRPLGLRSGEGLQLKVEAVSRSGVVRDVTRRAATEYASMTLWSVDVKPGGYVIAQPAYRFDRGEIDRVDGAVSVFYVNRARKEVGLAMLKLRVLRDTSSP